MPSQLRGSRFQLTPSILKQTFISCSFPNPAGQRRAGLAHVPEVEPRLQPCVQAYPGVERDSALGALEFAETIHDARKSPPSETLDSACLESIPILLISNGAQTGLSGPNSQSNMHALAENTFEIPYWNMLILFCNFLIEQRQLQACKKREDPFFTSTARSK